MVNIFTIFTNIVKMKQSDIFLKIITKILDLIENGWYNDNNIYKKIMKGKKIMQKETKKERFDRISEARKIKILDGIRLLENCSNKSNYEYTMMK